MLTRSILEIKEVTRNSDLLRAYTEAAIRRLIIRVVYPMRVSTVGFEVAGGARSSTISAWIATISRGGSGRTCGAGAIGRSEFFSLRGCAITFASFASSRASDETRRRPIPQLCAHLGPDIPRPGAAPGALPRARVHVVSGANRFRTPAEDGSLLPGSSRRNRRPHFGR